MEDEFRAACIAAEPIAFLCAGTRRRASKLLLEEEEEEQEPERQGFNSCATTHTHHESERDRAGAVVQTPPARYCQVQRRWKSRHGRGKKGWVVLTKAF